MPKELSSCKHASMLMSKSMEEDLSVSEKMSLTAHLAMCKTCCFCYNQFKTIKETIGHYSDVIFSQPLKDEHMLSDEAKKRIRESLN